MPNKRLSPPRQDLLRRLIRASGSLPGRSISVPGRRLATTMQQIDLVRWEFKPKEASYDTATLHITEQGRSFIPGSKMPEADIAAIVEFARLDGNLIAQFIAQGPYLDNPYNRALTAYRKNLDTFGVRGTIEQKFMAEYDHPRPDINLRALYRSQILSEHPSAKDDFKHDGPEH